MTKEEYNEAAALVVRLRKELEHTNQHLVAHIDALTKSNAQCGEYLRQNEQLHSELVNIRAALASVTEQRDSLQRTLDEWERADTTPHERVTPDDVADHVVPPVLPWQDLPLCQTCHGCGAGLVQCNMESAHDCPRTSCNRTCTTDNRGGYSPWSGNCASPQPVRHE